MEVEELLEEEGREGRDPFNRFSSLEHDAVLVVEFSERVGPKPALLIPASPGEHLEADELALWLMTADYQMGSGGGSSFAVPEDVALVVANEEQGIHAFVHHLTLFDLAARGHHRPFVVAYLTREPQLIHALLPSLAAELARVLAALKRCNRKLFLRELAQAMDTLDSVRSQAVSAYYELYYDNNGLPNGAASEKLHLKTRKTHQDLQLTHAALAKALAQASDSDSSAQGFRSCSSHHVSIDHWLGKLFERIQPSEETKLKPLAELAPCVYKDVETQLRHIWSRFSRQSAGDQLFRPLFPERGASVHMDGVPLLTVPLGRGEETAVAEEEDEEWERGGEGREGRSGKGREEAAELVGLLAGLPSVVLALWTGQFLLVRGSELRRWTVQSVVTKLRRLVPTAERSPPGLCRRWHRGRVPPTAFLDFKLFGLSLAAGAPLSEAVASNVLPFLSVVDLSGEAVTGWRVRGGRLGGLADKAAELFPSDALLAAQLECVGWEYGALAYLLHVLVFADADLYRKRARHLDSLAARLRLLPYELRILRHFVTLLKEQTQAPSLQGDFDSLFLDSQPLVSIKL